jgi:hypothetical protein
MRRSNRWKKVAEVVAGGDAEAARGEESALTLRTSQRSTRIVVPPTIVGVPFNGIRLRIYNRVAGELQPWHHFRGWYAACF